MTTNKTLDIVEKLIQTCRDGEEGYRSAAEHTKDSELRDFFNRQSMERARFSGELQTAARSLGEPSPSKDSSVASKLHRAWFDLKQKMGGGEVSVLESVETGEEAARQEYRDALSADLPFEIQSIVQRQSESISVAHDRISTLVERFKKAA